MPASCEVQRRAESASAVFLSTNCFVVCKVVYSYISAYMALS